MKNKAQLGGVILFVFLLVAIIIIAPVILKLSTSFLNPIATKFSEIDATNKSADVVVFTKNKITGSFDWVIMLIIIFNILILLISAFLIDINPAFLVIYIIGAFVLVITAPFSIAAAEKIYTMSQFTTGSDNVVQYIPMTEFILNNFGVVIVGVLILTGIIIYAKVKFFSQGGQSGNY